MNHTFEMKNLFHAVAIEHFDTDEDGELNEQEMRAMLDVYALHSLSLEEHYKLPESIRTVVEELRGAHILDVNVKREEERTARIMQEMRLNNG